MIVLSRNTKREKKETVWKKLSSTEQLQRSTFYGWLTSYSYVRFWYRNGTYEKKKAFKNRYPLFLEEKKAEGKIHNGWLWNKKLMWLVFAN